MVADLLALRRVPARFFGVYMSVNPVFAALIGLMILGQALKPADWLATGTSVTANAVSMRTASGADRHGPTRAAARGGSAAVARAE